MGADCPGRAGPPGAWSGGAGGWECRARARGRGLAGDWPAIGLGEEAVREAAGMILAGAARGASGGGRRCARLGSARPGPTREGGQAR